MECEKRFRMFTTSAGSFIHINALSVFDEIKS